MPAAVVTLGLSHIAGKRTEQCHCELGDHQVALKKEHDFARFPRSVPEERDLCVHCQDIVPYLRIIQRSRSYDVATYEKSCSRHFSIDE